VDHSQCAREEIVKLQERWTYGASVCVYFAVMGLFAFGVTALCAGIWILPCQAIFGDFSDKSVRDGLIVTAIVVVPLFMSLAMEHAPSPDE
jgi:hypothetical protein